MNCIQEAVNKYAVKHRITKGSLAKKLGCSRSSFFSKLKGTSGLSLSEGYQLSRVLGCTLDELYLMTEKTMDEN